MSTSTMQLIALLTLSLPCSAAFAKQPVALKTVPAAAFSCHLLKHSEGISGDAQISGLVRIKKDRSVLGYLTTDFDLKIYGALAGLNENAAIPIVGSVTDGGLWISAQDTTGPDQPVSELDVNLNGAPSHLWIKIASDLAAIQVDLSCTPN